MALAIRRQIIARASAFCLTLFPATAMCQESPAQDMNAPPLEDTAVTRTGDVVHPVKVSENGHYFVDQRGHPVFWLGTTQWYLFLGYNLEDAATILEKSRANGFAFIQAAIMGGRPNVYGEWPFTELNPLTPNEAYFKHVDAVIQIARDNNVTISMTLFHQHFSEYITVQNARWWGKWIAERYQDIPNIVWSMTPKATPEFLSILRELAAGLREGDRGRHLITFKPDPAPYSSSFIHGEEWLDFNSIQTWKGVDLIYPMVTKDYEFKSTKPVLMAEGAYEQGTEYGFEISPLWIRRQAYYSFMAGGHHAYGHNVNWRVLPSWKAALDAPGATQLGILKKTFLDRKEWWNLVPDQTIFASGGSNSGSILNLAARHKDGAWIMAYIGGTSSYQRIMGYLGRNVSVSIHMDKVTAGTRVDAAWMDPRTGQSVSAGRYPNTGVQTFSKPDGWEDALLILEASDE
jgi:hypothetical protein